jgi:hypothetical protein
MQITARLAEGTRKRAASHQRTDPTNDPLTHTTPSRSRTDKANQQQLQKFISRSHATGAQKVKHTHTADSESF